MKHFAAILPWLIAFNALSQPSKERVILFPDRNLYISGEPVRFSALIKPENDSLAVSRILYCELITPVGKRIAGEKYSALNSVVSGNLVIPPDLISGVYYLKAYTRSMRQEGHSAYSYDYIKVVNPHRSEVNDPSGELIHADSEKAEDLMNEFIRRGVKVPEVVLPGQTARIEVDTSICHNLKNLTISVIPENTFSNRIVSPDADGVKDSATYLQETNGLLITGIVKSRLNDSAVPGIRVNLSIIGEGRDFISVVTGPDGRFVFPVPDYTGNRDIFLCTEGQDSLDSQIFIDNDFCNLPVSMPDWNFELSPEERQTALNMAVSFNLDTYFNSDPADDLEYSDTSAFYGKPDEILVMDEYVQLPTLEDYFNQLPVSVKVRKRSGHKYFKVLGTQDELMEIDPLVMVDLVVIDDPEKVLALEPRNISRIDIVNSVYVKGSMIYGGIVNIISAKGDFAGISLPSSGLFINYSFLSRYDNIPEYPGNRKILPDTRNTFLWKVLTEPDECQELSFIAPDTPGKYLIVVRAADEQGKEVSGTFSFNVQGH
ncbi:MAG TPA: hypothetical protein VK207_09890 [Bacteroidales bacterium]|nr:hypothetical protein [Bacteroidales bacterium]